MATCTDNNDCDGDQECLPVSTPTDVCGAVATCADDADCTDTNGATDPNYLCVSGVCEVDCTDLSTSQAISLCVEQDYDKNGTGVDCLYVSGTSGDQYCAPEAACTTDAECGSVNVWYCNAGTCVNRCTTATAETDCTAYNTNLAGVVCEQVEMDGGVDGGADGGPGYCAADTCEAAADCATGSTCYNDMCVDICGDAGACDAYDTNKAGVECAAVSTSNTDTVCKPLECTDSCPDVDHVCVGGACVVDCTTADAGQIDDLCDDYDMGMGVECAEGIAAPNADLVCQDGECTDTCDDDLTCYTGMCVDTCDDDDDLCPDDCSATNTCETDETCLNF
ncbi:MAG: hypothetical protein GY854_04005 [Deltaproteobacteria bacterium]|nr:hypothetical protein [Deltaproteobacteria bacterium]